MTDKLPQNVASVKNGSGPLEPNLSDAEQFIRILTGEEVGYGARVTFQWFDDQKKGRVFLDMSTGLTRTPSTALPA